MPADHVYMHASGYTEAQRVPVALVNRYLTNGWTFTEDLDTGLGPVVGGGSVSDATVSAKGVLQLTGDLAGTATAPTVIAVAGGKTPATLTAGVVPDAQLPARLAAAQLASTIATAVTAEHQLLVGDSPAALDTIRELSAALGDDPNKITTLAAAIAAKVSKTDADTAYGLAPTATKTAAYTVAAGELALMNVPAGGTALTLPPAPADRTRTGVRAIGATSAVPLVLTAGGSDTIGDTGATTVSQPLAGEVTVLQYQAAATRWLAVANVKSMASLDARYPVIPASGKLAASQLDTAAIAASSDLSGTYQQTLTVVATVSAAATLAGDRHTPLDASGGAFTVTLPTPTRIGQQVRAEKIDAGTNVITIAGTLRGVADTVSLRFTSEVRTFVAESLTSWRVASGNTPKSGFDTVYAQLGTVLRPIAGESSAACAARIQAALDATSAVTLSGGDFTPSEPLRLNTGQQLTLWNARVIRQDNGATSGSFNTQVIVNKNPNATGNSDIRVRGIGRASLLCAPELLTTAKRNPDTSNGRPRVWENIGVAFVNCQRVRVEGVQIGPVNAFAGNTQLCSDVIWSDIELAQDASVINQDGIDVGPGSSDIHIRRVTGQTGDDFCSIYAQTTSGSIEQTYVRPYLLAQASRANITNLFVKQCSVAPGLTSGNMFRVQAGDGATLSRLFIDSIEVLGTLAQTFMVIGPTAYITTAPAMADLAGIEIRNVSGRFPRFLSLDAPCSNIAAANITHSAGTFVEVIGFQVTNAHPCSNISVDGVRVLPTTAGGTLVHLRSAAATTKVSVKNAYLGYATALLNDEYGNTGIHLDDIKVGVLAGVPFQVKAATSGTVASIAWDQATAAVTAIHTGGASSLRLGALMPALTSADATPAPVFGSWLLCESSKNPTGDSVSGAGMYLGTGTAWARVTVLAGDTQAPTVPGTPTATAGTQKIDLTWAASTDNVGVSGYRVYRSDAPTAVLGTATGTSYSDTTATVGTAYTYTVSAYDAAGNESAKSTASNSATATAPSGTTTYSADTFTRTSSTSPGSTETGAYAWTAATSADQSKWATNGTRLTKASGNALTAPKELLIDDGRADGTLQVTFVSALASTSGLVFRVAADGSTGLMVSRTTGGAYQIQSRSGTTYTSLYTSSAVGAAADVVKVILSGSNITLAVNGSVLTSLTSTVGQTATKHGVWAGSDANTTSFDDWTHTSATA